MCVICVKPQGQEFPTNEKIAQMFASNNDGAGFMYVRDGKVEIRKGFMKLKHLLRAIKREQLTKEHTVVMHFRIGTTGSNTQKNTHPFPVSKELKELRALNITVDVGMAHNGILSYGGDKENDLSDTACFVREVLSHEPIKASLFDLPTFTLIESAIGSSKMVFLNGSGDFVLLGDWKEDDKKEDKCFYSNLNFAWRASVQKGTYYSWENRRDRELNTPIYGYVQLENGMWVSEEAAKAIKAAKLIKEEQKKGEVIFLSNDAAANAQAQKDWDIMSEDEWKAAKKEQEDAKKGKDFANSVFVDYDDRECPQCKYPIESAQRINCSKCGVFFYRPHEAEYYGGY